MSIWNKIGKGLAAISAGLAFIPVVGPVIAGADLTIAGLILRNNPDSSSGSSGSNTVASAPDGYALDANGKYVALDPSSPFAALTTWMLNNSTLCWIIAGAGVAFFIFKSKKKHR
jgi:hypothetical protein